MQRIWPIGIAASLLLNACMPQPTGPSIAPDGQTVKDAQRVLAGTIQGSKVTSSTRVALVGYFANASGQRLDAQGRPATDDILVSVPVKDGRYGIGLPVPPSGPPEAPMPAVRGRFALMAFDDVNGNQRQDEGEAFMALPESDTSITFAPFAGYTIQRLGVASTDPTYFDKVNLTFN